MALSNTVQLRDGMSNVLSRIASSLSAVNDRFERMQSLSEQAAPTGLYSQFNSELAGVREELTRTVSEVEELRSGMTSAQPPAENLTASLKKLGTAFLGSKLVSGIVSMSDEMTQTTARLNLMNDGLQSTADLQELIYQSAMRSRGAYNATADAVAKMGLLAGDAFSSNQETIAFVEQLNKQFKIAGTSAEGQAAAMLQITQAMGSGVLRGEELNSVFEQAPTIIQSIADYLGVSVGEIRSMAQEGELTASVVKSALLSSAEETNRKFNEIPLTWSDVWTQASNMAIMALQPLLEAINWVANNIEVIGPLVLAAAAAFCAVCGGRQLDEDLCCGYEGADCRTENAQCRDVAQPDRADYRLDHHSDRRYRRVHQLHEPGEERNDERRRRDLRPVRDGRRVCLQYVLSAGLQRDCRSYQLPRQRVPAPDCVNRDFVFAAQPVCCRRHPRYGEDDREAHQPYSGREDQHHRRSGHVLRQLHRQHPEDQGSVRVDGYVKHKEKIEYSTAYANGYNWGANLQNSISEKLGLDLPDDPATGLLSNIADNTAQIADDVSVSSDDIKLLRDIAERQVINKYTTAEIKVEMVNHNNISNEMDLDGVVNLLEAKVTEALVTSAEGVHI